MKKYSCMLSLLTVLSLLLVFTSCRKTEPVYSAGDSSFYASLSRPVNAEGGEYEDSDMASLIAGARDVFVSSRSRLDGTSDAFREINSDVDMVLDCDAEILSVINRVIRLSAQTDGAFQPCGGAYSALLGGSSSPADDELAAAETHIGTDKFEISENSIKKNDRLAAFDLSAVADGYAMEKAVAYIEEKGVEYGTVTAGNAVAVLGEKPDGEKYNIAVPDGDGYLGWFSVPKGYVAYVDGNSNICDFGKGNNEYTCVAVYAADGLTAAALADAVWIGGSECEKSISEAFNGAYCMAVKTVNGDIIISQGAVERGMFIMSETDGE